MTFRRRSATCLLVLAACVAWAPAARAHGGAFGPPPPPEAKGPPGGGDGPPAHVDPGFGGPIVTPSPGGAVNPRPSKRTTPLTTSFETSWQLWWDLNRLGLLPARLAPGPAAAPATGSDGTTETAEAWEAARARAVKERLEPFLLRLLEPGAAKGDDVIASACLALGKVATAPKAINVLLGYAEDDKQSGLVRESAALALGLLRRSEPAQRFTPLQYDVVRGRLLKLFDQYVSGAKKAVPLRTRAFAMFAIALLGDQPFQPMAVNKDGRLLSKLLWQRLGVPYKDRQLHIALLTAIGTQPRAGIPDGVRDGLKAIVLGKKALGHQWDAFKRAHAVTAFARLGGPSANALLLRIANDKMRNVVLRFAATLAIGDRAPLLAAAERSAAVRVLKRAFVLEQELLGVGLANVALGRMVGADLAAGSTRVISFDEADELLIQRAEKAPWYVRGFAALGLALAAREGDPADETVRRFRTRAQMVLLRMARAARAEVSVRGAGAVGLGLLGQPGTTPAVRALVSQADLHAEVRGHAALALGQIGQPTPEVLEVLTAAVGEAGNDQIRGPAALGLSLLGAKGATPALLAQLGADADASTRRLASVTLALGRLGDLSAVDLLLASAGAKDGRELVRAMALVSLGRLLDPERRPSLLRLTRGVCYPARTDAFQELFTLL
jgi:HEAT repeat protein